MPVPSQSCPLADRLSGFYLPGRTCMHAITSDAVVIGVDTHKDVHVAVAINGLGARLATASFPVTSAGYQQVAAWAAELGIVHAFGVEGTGSYGAGLTCALLPGPDVLEVVGRTGSCAAGRASPNLDAEFAARAVLAGRPPTTAQLGDGPGGDDPPPQDRPGYRGEGAHPGHGHAEGVDGHRTRGFVSAPAYRQDDSHPSIAALRPGR